MKKAVLFEPYKKPNRRLTAKELETEYEICSWLKRPPRSFFNDPPTYPWLPPEPVVNFKLNYTE